MRWIEKLNRSERRELLGYYSGRRLIKTYHTTTDWQGELIDPMGMYVEFCQLEEPTRPGFINVMQEISELDFQPSNIMDIEDLSPEF